MSPNPRILQVAAALIVLGAAGCAVPVPGAGEDGRTVYMTRAELAEYAEAVFRSHNRVLTELMQNADQIEAADPDTRAALLDAESAMLEACEPLNTLAAAIRDDRPLDRQDRNRIPHVTAACARTTGEVEALLGESLSTDER